MSKNFEGWNEAALLHLKEKGTIRDFEQKPQSKFHNEKTMVDDKPFHSKKEAKRYKVLNLMLKKGLIGFLARQVEFELNVGGTHSFKYVADFCYREKETGNLVVEDVKGMRTRIYLKKKKLMLKVHGIEIKET